MDWAVLHKAGYLVNVEPCSIDVDLRIKRLGADVLIPVHAQSFLLPDSIQNRAKQAFDIATNHFVRNRLET